MANLRLVLSKDDVGTTLFFSGGKVELTVEHCNIFGQVRVASVDPGSGKAV